MRAASSMAAQSFDRGGVGRPAPEVQNVRQQPPRGERPLGPCPAGALGPVDRRAHGHPRRPVVGEVDGRRAGRVRLLQDDLPQHLVGYGLTHRAGGLGQCRGQRHAPCPSEHLLQAPCRDREGGHIAPREHGLHVAAPDRVGHLEGRVDHQRIRSRGRDQGDHLGVGPRGVERHQAPRVVHTGEHGSPRGGDLIHRLEQMKTEDIAHRQNASGWTRGSGCHYSGPTQPLRIASRIPGSPA